jgi:hypothetical protein
MLGELILPVLSSPLHNSFQKNNSPFLSAEALGKGGEESYYLLSVISYRLFSSLSPQNA